MPTLAVLASAHRGCPLLSARGGKRRRDNVCLAGAVASPQGPLLATIIAAVAAAQDAPQGAPPPTEQIPAAVFRDEHGVPHIVAESEVSAWYALGYEQARDALLWIQYACKSAKGELTWVRGTSGLTSDIAVKVFNSHGRLAAMSPTLRHQFFQSTNPNIQANFYDNCVAFAAGADAYRLTVKNAPTTGTPEAELHNWLAGHGLPQGQTNLSWVFNDPIDALDIAAQGAWTTAGHSIYWPNPSGLVNSIGPSYSLIGSADPSGLATGPTTDPLAPGNVELELDRIRKQVSVLAGAPSAFSGSNSFAWSRLYCQDPSTGTRYSGLLGDPHVGVPAHKAQFAEAFFDVPIHMWFAHVQVTPPGSLQPSFDFLGHFPHAAAVGFTGHNRDIAMGGTLGAPNFTDHFLLRLEEIPFGSANAGHPVAGPSSIPYNYYSYYDETGTTNTTYRPLVTRTLQIKRWDNQLVTIPYWQADSFGVVLPDRSEVERFVVTFQNPLYPNGPVPPQLLPPIIYGDHVAPNTPAPRWRVAINPDPEPMRFWKEPQIGTNGTLTSPMVVSLRAPMDAAVGGEDMHWQLLRDVWEMEHATQLTDVINKTNGAAYLANVCFVDRQGRTFSTQLSAIPERGNDAALFAAVPPYHSADKQAIYNKSLPVPARDFQDKMFDWQFNYTAVPIAMSLRYLPYPPLTTNSPPTIPFKPAAFQDPGASNTFPPAPGTSVAFPPTSTTSGIQSGFFTSVCNDQIWGFSRKRESVTPSSANPLPFNDWVVNGNQLLQFVLDRGVPYVTGALGLEAPDRQQIVVQQFTQLAQNWVSNTSPKSLTPDDIRKFVVTSKLYNDTSYTPPGTGISSNPNLPTTIRQLKEVVDNLLYSDPPTGTESPVVSAQKELEFFNDFWNTLFSGQWDQHQVVGAPQPLQVSLRDLWVNGNVATLENKVFWYDNPNGTNPVPRWIDLPPAFPLIDFFWPESEVSHALTSGASGAKAGNLDPHGLSSSEVADLGSLVSQLVNWYPQGGPDYRMVPSSTNATSTGAGLLEMMRMGYDAAGPDYGRHWVQLRRGEVQYSGPTGWARLNSSGQLPQAGTLVRQDKPWAALSDLAFPFPDHQLASLFHPASFVAVPYSALYDAPGHVRATLRPEDTNALVRFFLALGNFAVDPQHNRDPQNPNAPGNPSIKLARFDRLVDFLDHALFLAGLPNSTPAEQENFFKLALPARYPLTDGLQRLTALRALLDTNAFVQPLAGSHDYGQFFRARAYGYSGSQSPGAQIWPPHPAGPDTDTDCVGGSLRAVLWFGDQQDPNFRASRGFQSKFLGLGGSIATMLALFPDNWPGFPNGLPPVNSYFWCTPGVEVMGSDPARFNAHMDAFSTNSLLPTHYDDFLNHVVSYVEHFYP